MRERITGSKSNASSTMVDDRCRTDSGENVLPILQKLVNTLREQGCSLNGNCDKIITLRIVKANSFLLQLSKKQRAWVKAKTLVGVVRSHGESIPGVKLGISNSKKSITLEDQTSLTPGECIRNLFNYIEVRRGRNVDMHIQHITDFYKQQGTAVRDVILNVRQDHRGREILPKSYKKGTRLKLFIEKYGKSVSGCAITLYDNDYLSTHTNGDGNEQKVSDASYTKKIKNNLLDYSMGAISIEFHKFVNSNLTILSKCADREEVSKIFEKWAISKGIPKEGTSCSIVMAVLRKQRLVRSKRYGDSVLMIFAKPDGTFPPNQEVKKTRSRVIKKREDLETNKGGVTITCSTDVSNMTVPPGHCQKISFAVKNEWARPAAVREVKVMGANKNRFQVHPLQSNLGLKRKVDVLIDFSSPGLGVFRAVVVFNISRNESIYSIARFITVRSEEILNSELLRPTSPYKQLKKKYNNIDEVRTINPPKVPSGARFLIKLPDNDIPHNVAMLLKYQEMESTLKSYQPISISRYADFWNHMLWASEYQASIDVKLFDLENVALSTVGRYFSLHVPGLAEGRPSVLKGDKVIVDFNGKSYKGRTVDTQLEKVILDFNKLFHGRYNPQLDLVNVRFTFTRTLFRLGHQGCKRASDTMGATMLFPEERDVESKILGNRERLVPNSLPWKNVRLNQEQRSAVLNVLKGSARPFPYIIFGPPGTGKTTTIVETIYHLVNHKSNMKILLTAPSNDATDNLVDQLADAFPPSEMRRVLAMSRGIEQFSAISRKYVKMDLSEEADIKDIMKKRIVACTVNMASKFFNRGIPIGHFDVLCVDEAGHAMETEVVSVASTLMNFHRNDQHAGQLILAGDPRQLGPVITSSLCKKYGMEISLMERLANRSVYSNKGGEYPKELITKLIRNFRSHPDILKLPNKMFYDNELIACGNKFDTHSMANWEHLPCPKFPVIFHSVFGESEREGNSPSWFNRQEAEIVLHYVRLLVKQSKPGIHMDEIGVITPYARQVQKIRLLLKAHDLGDVKVGSVETFQGQERKCIIVSTVRSSEHHLVFDAKYNLGFVNHPKRFNVTVTRAKSLLVAIGHPHVLATDKDHWLPLLRMCHEAGSWVGEPWNENADTEEKDLQEMGMLDGDDDDDNDEDTENEHTVSHVVAQEAVGFFNREE